MFALSHTMYPMIYFVYNADEKWASCVLLQDQQIVAKYSHDHGAHTFHIPLLMDQE